MGHSLANEILCQSCMHSIPLKINSARDSKTARIYTLCFLPSQHTLHTGFSWTTLHRTGLPPALPDEDFLHVFIDFHINTNTLDILLSPKNPRQKVSLTSASETASQHYQGTFCSVKTLLCHLQQCSPRNTPDYCKDARKTRKVHELGKQMNIFELWASAVYLKVLAYTFSRPAI